MSIKVFHLPDLGEGLQEAEIISWKVAVGDSVLTDQLMVEVKTQKAIVEIPSPYSGLIKALHGKPGEIIPVGKPLVTFEVAGTTDSGAVSSEVHKDHKDSVRAETTRQEEVPAESPRDIRAMLIARKRASELGVAIGTISGTGNGGVITVGDVESAATHMTHVKETNASEVVYLSGVRKLMARAMEVAHREVVATTIFDKARLPHSKKISDVTPRLIYAIVAGCKAEPALNAWYDSKNQTITRHSHVNLGLAVNTKHGLFVPVIPLVDTLVFFEMRAALLNVKKATLEGSALSTVAPTITLSNIGTSGAEYATAIILPPQVAIVVAGRIGEDIRSVEGEILRYKILPLSLTFDHRVITGVEAAVFMTAMIKNLEAWS